MTVSGHSRRLSDILVMSASPSTPAVLRNERLPRSPTTPAASTPVGTCVSSHAPRPIRTCGFPAYGSYLGCVTAQVAVYAPAPVTREPGSESSTCFAGAYSPWPPPFAPPTPLRPPPQTPPQGAFLALFAGFTATMTRSDFSCPCIIGFGSSPSRCGPSRSRNI